MPDPITFGKMITVFPILGLVLGIGFAFLFPVLIKSVANINALFGHPEGARALPTIFKIGIWFSLAASAVHLAAMFFLDVDLVENAIHGVIGLVLAWRLSRALKKTTANEPTRSGR